MGQVTETRDGNHDSKEDAAEGTEEGSTEAKGDGIALSKSILGIWLRCDCA